MPHARIVTGVERHPVKPTLEPRTSLITAVIAGAFALLGALIGSYATSYFTFRNQLRIAEMQKREEAYAALAGDRVLLSQLYVSAMQARIDFEFHHRKLELEGRPVTSPHVQEAQRLVMRRDDLALEFGRANRQLYETIGRIRANFKRTAELDQLTQRIYSFKTPTIVPPTDLTDPALLLKWRNDRLDELHKKAETEYGKPIDDLLAYVLTNLASPS